jgi:hypothetical protein
MGVCRRKNRIEPEKQAIGIAKNTGTVWFKIIAGATEKN